ncbi:TetR/AcrR family transcriptional regulator [Fodinicola acaciae]|uniref:TetR/AcrR family transcriptional regulator n=1 Tax=Fodinicola acaciae TaxID=2681555 RepID=UPI0013D66A75|nr:TetR/AcrR family transcriptional regulator [Fodinicola acaciae]
MSAKEDGRSARSLETRGRIFQATLKLIAERGAVEMSVDEIAATAGVAKGTIFYNFGSKSGLIEALLTYGVDRVTEAMSAAAQGKAPLDAMTAMVGTLLDFVDNYHGYAQLLVAEMWLTKRQWDETLRLVRSRVIGLLQDGLDEAVRAGVASPDLRDTGLAASALFGSTLVVALDNRLSANPRPTADVRDELLSLIRARATG